MTTTASAFLDPARGEFAAGVLAGLTRQPKTLPCRYFYDAHGSELFERITELREYYPTRAEIALLEAHAGEMAALAGPRCCLIEFGSGSSRKTDILLRALPDLAAYIPIDISEAALAGAARRLAQAFPGLRVWPIHGDFNADLKLPAWTYAFATQAFPRISSGARSRLQVSMREAPGGLELQPVKRLGFFPGSTIGNFTQSEAIAFLRRARRLLGANSALIVGADLKKDAATLIRAYDDSAGVTAQFNLNLLRRINRELGADFDLGSFAHLAIYNEEAGRIEMHLRSTRAQTVTIAGRRIRFQAGETIHTENSHKYAVEEFQAMARSAGWKPRKAWIGPDRLFSVHYLEPDGA
jgi:uncharacterized SAM-dependent methyltransferase